ncbi:protein lethal(2)essential for life [Harpegnathos saltator]|uniref:Protein lethal(2)essential for life n=1 Tax=Harpegnathos saltator TaxID=610380 RepID=E2BB06_HARSA|nr:protein lethal(2)essential for life [Harpegnathos saltator]EFN87097.1 Protein lethal(2)essential for life [Harpegnathos saltator]
MYLLPLLLSAWWTDFDRPHRMMDQNLALAGFNPDESILSRPLDRYYPSLRDQTILDLYYRPWMDVMRRKNGAAMMGIASDNDNFKVIIDVRQFKPEEVNVKVVGRCIVVEAKHEEKRDEHGSISRQFLRKYLLPDRADLDQVSSSISLDGILIITAPLKKESEEPKERVIKIQQTGRPALRGGGTVDEDRSSTTTESSATTRIEKDNIEDNEIREELTTQGQEKGAKPEK